MGWRTTATVWPRRARMRATARATWLLPLPVRTAQTETTGLRDGSMVATGEGRRNDAPAAKAMEAIGRNPEATPKIQTAMILAIAFTEAIAIYALVVALIIKFV